LETLNLPSLVEKEGSIQAVIRHEGFISKNKLFYGPGEIRIIILPNNLTCGYVGNTILTPISKLKSIYSNTQIEVNGSLYIKCILMIDYNNIVYTLKKRYNYLRIKAIEF
jgi:hypothetical protein